MIRLGSISSDIARDLLVKLRNEPELVAPLGANFRYMSWSTLSAQADQMAAGHPSTERCLVYDNQDPIGFVSLTGIDYLNSSAEFSIQLLPEAQGKGYGKDATVLMVRHGFLNLNLNRIYLDVLEDNFSAIKCYLACGFKTEGTLRQSVFKQGEYKNQRVMSILAEESEWKDV